MKKKAVLLTPSLYAAEMFGVDGGPPEDGAIGRKI